MIDADPNPVTQYFNYDKKAFPPAGCAQVATDDQAQACISDLLRGSLDEITYGWFANPFINRSHPERHFPILDVRSSLTCPDGSTPSLSDTGPAVCHICDEAYGGPCSYPAKYDSATDSCVCQSSGATPPPHTVSPTAKVHFDYAVDTDGDGIPNVDDNCPGDQNPGQSDSDGDGIGDDCDPCPHSDLIPGQPDKDNDCVPDAVDNCPNTYNPDQTNSNVHAEEKLGIGRVDPTDGTIHPRGDACDPYPSSTAATKTNALVDQFSASCTTPSAHCTPGDWVAQQEIDWNGEQMKSNPSANGITQLAHCNCGISGDVDTRVKNCKLDAQLHPLCTIATHTSYPGADGTSINSRWVSESTQPLYDNSYFCQGLGLCCYVNGTCPTNRNYAFSSNYVYNTWTSGNAAALWRFDQDLDLLGSPQVNSEQDLIDASKGFDGLGWAYTSELDSTQFTSTQLAADPLNQEDAANAAKAGNPNATVADAADHYFVQDPRIIFSILLGPLACPPGAPCGRNLTSIVDQPCLTCLRDGFPTWLLKDGNVIVQMSQGISADETGKLDSGLVTMLTDPNLTLVPVSEPVAFLRAQQNPLRAYAVESQTLALAGYVGASDEGMYGVPSRPAVGDPPVTRVLAASAMQEKIYGIIGGVEGEQLLVIPGDGSPPLQTPLTGIDADAVPLSLVYRAQDAHLYLVDETQRAWWSCLRLVRITQSGAAATVLASTPYFRAGSSVYLSATQSGDLLLAESKSPGSTLFMTLAPTADSVELTGWLVRQGSLLAPPDSRGASGVSVAMRHGRHGGIQALEIPGDSFRQPDEPHELPLGWDHERGHEHDHGHGHDKQDHHHGSPGWWH